MDLIINYVQKNGFVPEIDSNEVPSLLIICHSSQRRYSSDDSFNLFSVTNLQRQNRTVSSVQAVTMAYGAKQAG